MATVNVRAAQPSDAIVVGLGAMGSSVCLQLAARGASVIGIDRYTPPHPWGSSHGDTRITRVGIGEGAEYVPLARRSHELWRAIEAESGVRLLRQAGLLVLAHPSSRFLAQTRASARAFGIEHEDLGNAELRRRFEMFAVDELTEAYSEPGAGYVRAEAAVAAQLVLARRHGARLALGERVERWLATDRGVTVSTDRATYEAAQMVLCPGPWIDELLAPPRGSFAVHRQQLYWWPIVRGYRRLREMPPFVWDLGGDQSGFVHLDGFYGFPAVDGRSGGVKVATETYERTAVPDGREHPATAAEVEMMRVRCIERHLPWLGARPVRNVSCLYTSTRGTRFLIDRHPDHASVIVVSACSGHGFKHSPAIGEAVAQWLLDGRPELDLFPFSFPRVVGTLGAR
ncbi:MAG: N-methyl-L-tryptophan oxidase [Solirubrobacteraceae bacterium]